MALIIVLSVLGYGSLLAFDLPITRKQPLIRVILALATTILLTTAFILGLQGSDSLAWSAWSRSLGLVLVVAGGLLAAYSALFEIPLRLARNRSKASVPAAAPDSNAIVQVGTYALCRHPGFLWMLFYLTGLVLFVSRTSTCRTCAVVGRVRFCGRIYPGSGHLPAYVSSILTLSGCDAVRDSHTSQPASRSPYFCGAYQMNNYQQKTSDLVRNGDYQRAWDRHCGFLDLSLDEFMQIQWRLLQEQFTFPIG